VAHRARPEAFGEPPAGEAKGLGESTTMRATPLLFSVKRPTISAPAGGWQMICGSGAALRAGESDRRSE
jgi:hypothetical protein